MLVGTIAVETSEYLSELLKRAGIPHNVLNAKEHAREAEIIKDAGQLGAVTIATNMAGRGVDIKLGEGVRELGGLYVLGTERHEARRIDNQLRGRSGRQGDPGETRFYLSGQDDLVRLFAGDRIYNIMERFKLPDDQPMEAKILSNQIENAQKKVEEQNFVMRKNVLKYDDVMNMQRHGHLRAAPAVLEGVDLSEEVEGWIDEVIERVVAEYTQGELRRRLGPRRRSPHAMQELYGSGDHARRSSRGRRPRPRRARRGVRRGRAGGVRSARGVEAIGATSLMRELERFVILQVVDQRWREHLENMDYLREGVHLRAMAQKDPLVEYRARATRCSRELDALIREEVVRLLFHAQLDAGARHDELEPQKATAAAPMTYEHEQLAGVGGNRRRRRGAPRAARPRRWPARGATAAAAPIAARSPRRRRIGRNDPCWCGTGKKYKKCHGA